MKKTFLIITFTLITIARADIKYDIAMYRFYSIPMTPEINLCEYNSLVLQTSLMSFQCWNNGVYGKKVRDQISSYLKTLNTPTSLRLLSDFEKNWN